MQDCDIEFRTASFAGIEFEIRSVDHSGGRRILTHTYPFADDHYNEDLGDNPLKWSVTGIFVGEDWRDRLTEAKQIWRRGGAGEYFDPKENDTFEVVLIDWSFSDDAKATNNAEFSLEFVEKGLEPYLNIGGSPKFLAATALARYTSQLRGWYLPRFNLYSNVAEVFRAYDSVRGYFNVLTRQFAGVGSFLGLTGSVNAMQPSRDAGVQFDQVTAVMDFVASDSRIGAGLNGGESSGVDSVGFLQAGADARIAGNIETSDQAFMAAAQSLGYLFEATLDSPTQENVNAFTALADRLKADANDPAIHCAVDGLLASFGQSVEIECRRTLEGTLPALVASYRIFGDVSEAGNILAMSNGVSGASISGVVYPCPS